MNALIVCTNHGSFPEKKGQTGLWLSELTHFYHVMQKRRVNMDFVSPAGGAVPVDARSLDLKDETNARYFGDDGFKAKLDKTLKPAEVDPMNYRLVYLVGGHGTMWDFPDNEGLQRIIRSVYENYGTVAAVGHGTCGLLNVTLSGGERLIKDKYLTAFSNMEETLVSRVTEVPFSLEDRLREYGAHYTKTMIPFSQYIEMDERLVTGQNPASARKVASKIVEELFEK